MTFNKWLDTFVEEKGLNTDYLFDVEGYKGGFVIISLEGVLEMIKAASKSEQSQIKTMIVKHDFANKSVMPYFEHLAKCLDQ